MTYLRFLRENAPWLFTGALLSFLSSFGQTFFISVFAGEIRAEFGLSNGQWGGIYTLGTAASAAIMVWAGGLADRFRIRTLGVVVLACLAAACLFMALNPAAALLPLVILVLRFFGQGMASHLGVVAMSRWFVATRGKALAVATFGFAAGEAALPITFVALKRVVDWHVLWVAAALFCLAMIPAMLLLLRRERTPQSMAKETASTGMDGRMWTRGEALRHPVFWALVPALMVFPAIGTAFWFHQVHFAEVKGWVHLNLVAVFPLGTAAFILSTAAFGWLIDRFGSAQLLPLYLLPLVFAFGLHWYAPTIGWTAVGVILMGLAGGGQATLTRACWAEFFGTAHIGAIKAAVAAVLVLGSAIGPGFTGLLIDRGVGIEEQYLVYAFVFLGCALAMLPALGRARAALPRAA